MKTKNIDANTRIKYGFCPAAYGLAYMLQRKRNFIGFSWWKTVAWNYHSVMYGDSFEFLLHWLLWSEKKEMEKRFARINRGSLIE